MAPTTKVQPLQLPQYDAFETVARCCHWDTYVQEKKMKMLTQVSPDYNSDVKLRNNVVYFVPSGPEEDYNKHGNLSYVIEWDLVIDRLGPNMYLLGQTIDSIQGYTSVLLTSNNYDKKLEKVSLITKGSPIIRSGGKFYHASSCLCEESLGLHEVILVIESSRSADAKWLFRNSEVHPNDHSLANIPFGEHSMCVKFNTIRSVMCPYPLTFQQNKQLIKSVNPQLTYTVGPVDQLSGGSEPLIQKNQKATKNNEEKQVEDVGGRTNEERSKKLQEIRRQNASPDSSTANEVQRDEVSDANHLHNCVTTLTAVVLVNIRCLLSEETVMQLMTLALIVALKYYVLPALWPPQTVTRATKERCDRENVEEPGDMFDATENDIDDFVDCNDDKS